MTTVNVIIVLSLLCGALGVVSGAGGHLVLTLTLWAIAGAPYAIGLLLVLGYLLVSGPRAIAGRRGTAPDQQPASPP